MVTTIILHHSLHYLYNIIMNEVKTGLDPNPPKAMIPIAEVIPESINVQASGVAGLH